MDKTAPYKIVIVEDEDIPRITSRSYFERHWGAQVWDAADGKTALDIIRHHKPDLVLLDVMINGPLNGWQVIAEIRQFDQQVRIILVTGQMEIDPQLKVYTKDVAAVIQKPVSLSEIESKVAEVLGGEAQRARLGLAGPSATEKKGSYEARKLVHEIANIHNAMRMKCERFILDYEDGFLKEVSDKALVEEAVAILKHVVQTIDSARSAVEKVNEL